jgi:hypothetical protein
MSNLPDTKTNNEQILNDIQSLQQFEQQLFNSLESNPNLTPEQQKNIIDKMNQLSNMRINLYKTLSDVNNFFQDALNTSIDSLKQQVVAINIVETELNQAKKRLEIIESEKDNKIRLVEINNYFGDKYTEHAQLMKIAIFTLLPIIILTFLYNKGILFKGLYFMLSAMIALIGSVFFWRRFASIIMRDNMNYQEYNWPFSPGATTTTSSGTTSDPWLTTTSTTSNLGTCTGDACCSNGMTYDASLNQCVVGKESFQINSILTKTQPGKYKVDYDLRE